MLPMADFEKAMTIQANDFPSESECYRHESYDQIFDDEISRALSKVPTQYRSVLLLVDVNGMSYKEAALILECPAGTVMSRLSRARQKLRGFLKPPA